MGKLDREHTEYSVVDVHGSLNTIDELTRLNGRLNTGKHGYQKAGDWSLPVLWGAALTYPSGVYGEIGFRNGLSAMAFLMAADETGGRVYSIDQDDCVQGLSNLQETGLAERHTFLRGNSQDGSTRFPEPLDVLYIDGDHTYSGVKADFELHYPAVKPGGVIFFHDPISWSKGVGQFLLDMRIFFLPIGVGLGILYKPFAPGQLSIRPQLSDKPVRVSA